MHRRVMGALGAEPSPPAISRRSVLGSLAAGSLAVWSLSQEGSGQTNGGGGQAPTLVPSNSTAGFNFPYYLYVPSNAREKPLLVEPVNSGAASDNFQEDIDAAKSTVEDGVARRISDELRVPLIVPVFANPASDGFYSKFVQALDTETMHIDSGKFERIDLQLLGMVDHARERLAEDGLDLPSEIMLNGFSASGNFVDNFTVFHPERVASVTAGAVNGMPTLPIAEAKGHTLNYQIGIADLEALSGEPFDRDAWLDVPLFCYMGADERSPTDDTLPYRDVWSEEQAEKARAVYGDDMQAERMTFSEAVHHEVGAGTRMAVYDDTGHSYSPEIVEDVVSFHRRHNDIEEVVFRAEPAAGAEELAIDAYVTAETTGPLDARVIRDSTEVTADATPIVPGVTNQRTVPLSAPISLGDDLRLEITEPAQGTTEPLLTGAATVRYAASFTTPPRPGDTSIEVSFGAVEGAERSLLSVVPSGSGPFWQRRQALRWVDPGDSGVETFTLDEGGTGVPFGAGDEVQLWLIPNGNQIPSRAVATDTATLGGDETGAPTASRCDVSAKNHDHVEIGFAEPPVAGDRTVAVATTVEAAFGTKARTRLFPETGGGQWGIGLAFVETGTDETLTYDVPEGTFTLGETAILRAFPEDWGNIEDAIEVACAVVGGVQFHESPSPDSADLTVEYYLPGDSEGALRVRINGTRALEESAPPGTLERRTLTLDSPPSGGERVDVQLVDAEGGVEHTAAMSLPGGERASLAFTAAPAAHGRAVAIEYDLAASVDVARPAIRLYTETGPSWGTLLQEVDPGTGERVVLGVHPDETGVPFRPGREIEVALVDGTDPYATEALAKATAIASEESDGPRQPPAPTATTGPATATETPARTSTPADGATTVSSTAEQPSERKGTSTRGETARTETTADRSETTRAGSGPPVTTPADAQTRTGQKHTVSASASGTASRTTEKDNSAHTSDSGGGTPGFGILSALSGLGGAAYLLQRRLSEGDNRNR